MPFKYTDEMLKNMQYQGCRTMPVSRTDKGNPKKRQHDAARQQLNAEIKQVLKKRQCEEGKQRKREKYKGY
ncbi:hypothetical protein HMPREF0542_11931 [Ligilactobacillus ruminis ATCC 25644]|uniref:Uncharacterized protein n=2 Tax=Ligilactobacillus ruminis TaxID=1623 RepID=E7FSQ4_9LACO|nr:hypothetical protein HMPREF0542_11931 [Ligilactobacillus ruminis ATCC 25644]